MNAVLLALLLLLHLPRANAHGLLTQPPQRGALAPGNKFNAGAFPGAPADQKAHFPAGDKDSAPGAAARSQIRAAGPAGWTPFHPTAGGFRWRAGVCGDEIGKPQAHMRGGEFYFGGKITAVYKQGGNIPAEVKIVAHHNGFVELHVCDVKRCGGEISESCFKEGHCHKLLRAPNKDCDSGQDKGCGPVDPVYPERWYLPCTTVPENVQETFGGKKMLYKLPKGLVCQHCVLHWFWSAANTCNPPGVVEYFEGEHGPRNWGRCFGQGGARGGFTKVQKDCAPDRFPEEYYQCADITIEAVHSEGPRSPLQGSPSASPEVDGAALPSSDPIVTPRPSENVFKEFSLVADGRIIRSLPDGVVVNIGMYNQIAIEAVTHERVSTYVEFFIDGNKVWTDYNMPYFMFGNEKRNPNYWENPITNRVFKLRAEADGYSIESNIMFLD